MKSKLLSVPYLVWMLVFTMIPLVMIGITAFTDNYKCPAELLPGTRRSSVETGMKATWPEVMSLHVPHVS